VVRMRNVIELEFPNRQRVPVDCADSPSALLQLETMIGDGGNHYVLFPDAWNMYNAVRDEELRRIYRAASGVFPDGISWLMLARLQGARVPHRLPGPSFMGLACEHGLKRHWGHYFYGGGPGVPEKLASALVKRYPGLNVVGVFSPPFRPLTGVEEAKMKEEIEQSRAHLLWVALGAPKQEYWMAKHLGEIDVPVMLGVGAAFDFYSGARPWAPAWIRNAGMEWAFRSLTGGRKTFVRNVRCVSAISLLLTQMAIRRMLGPKSKEQRAKG